MTKTASTLLSLALLAPAAALAQEGPPKILAIYREQVRPGKGRAHEKNETAWAQAFVKAGAPTQYIAATSITGPTEAWYFEARQSYAELEKANQTIEANAALSAEIDVMNARDGELVSSVTQMLAVYNRGLSYRPNVEVPKMRYFRVDTVQVAPGHLPEFEALRKLVNEVHEKANMDEHWAVYNVVSGAPSGTCLIFIPMKSLAEMDAAEGLHGEAYQRVVGEDNRNRIRDLTGKAIASSRSAIFQFNPKMSAISKEFAAGDPDFWTPKPAAAAPTKK